MSSAIVNKPDIVQTLLNEGIPLKGNKISCPFHEDKNPSMAVYPVTNSWYCFSCGIGGDSITFIMKYRSISFKQALKYFGVSDHVPQQISGVAATKRRLIDEFRQWEQAYYGELCTLFRMIQTHKTKVKCIDDISQSAYHAEPLIEYWMDVLMFGDDRLKFELFREVADGKL